MKTLILTEGSRTIGIGHITRCIALYDELENQGLNPEFFINGDDSINELLKNKNHTIIDWLDFNNRKKYINGFDCIIIDSYLADLNVYLDASNKSKLLVSIDDFNRLPYPSGIVIKSSQDFPKSITHPSVVAPQSITSINPAVTVLIGNPYLLLRKEFVDTESVGIRKNIKTFFITFGGDDIRGLTPKVLKLLNERYTTTKKIVIIGPSFKPKNIEEIKSVTDKNSQLIYNATAAEMKKNMLKSDLAISAGGQTINELARVGLPTITVVVAENQVLHVQSWERNGFIVNAGHYQDKKLLESISKKILTLQPDIIRKKLSQIGRQLIDGHGPSRIVETIINKISQ